MVNISFLRRIFSVQPEETKIPAIELGEWLDSFSEDKLGAIKKRIKDNLDSLQESLLKVSQAVNSLSNSELTNENLSPRELHVVKGNKMSYVKKAEHFLSAVNIPKQDYGEIAFFCNWFENELEDFSKSTIKGYYILKNYFGDDAYNVATNIKSVEERVISLKELVNSKEVKLLNQFFERIKEFNISIIRANKLTSELAECEKELKSLIERIESVNNKINVLKNSSDFELYNKLENEKVSIEKQLKDIKIDLSKKFLGMQRALKKFEHASGENLVRKYLSDPINTLLEDTSLAIVDVLQRLKKEVDKDKISLKEKNKKKVQESVEKLDKDYFDRISAKIKQLQEQKSLLNTQIEKQTVMMNYKELQYQLEHLDRKNIDTQTEIQNINSELSEINLAFTKEKLERELLDFTNKHIIIEYS
ncbi:hypothetical protein JW930_01590 [Candidatus Woesearchaeota archaeon]|nr:hypothetical protein [Candidatus Woesearchaeota archaeon]